MNDIKIDLIKKFDDWYKFSVYMKAGDFSGRTNFGIMISDYEKLICDIEKMYVELEGEFLINYEDSDDYVKAQFKNYGHLEISAQLGGSWNDNFVKLLMYTDQTMLPIILQQLKQLSR